MSRFLYYSTIDDWWTLLEEILKDYRVRFAVDRPYALNQCEYFATINEEIKQAVLTSTRRIFIVGPDFSPAPLFLRMQPAGEHAGKFFIDETRGGPAIDMSVSAQFEERGLFWFGDGRLCIRDRYWNEASSESYPASQELKRSFDSITKTVQSRMCKRMIANRIIWFSPAVWELFESGKAALPAAGKCYTIDGETLPPKPWMRKPIKG